ncbi:MAG: hypothetical protein JXX28_16425 [Deltaproteobacteria bacterium]|nr:hypothetical protein [Deltaproteobacteria bacterium]
MSIVRPLVLGLVLSAGWSLPAVVPAAFAQSPAAGFEQGVLYTLLPAGALPGDGSLVQLHVLALDAQGQPITGLKLKATASDGKVSGVAEGQDGVYLVSMTTPRVQGDADITVTVKGRTEDRVSLHTERSYRVSSRESRRVVAELDPPKLVLGDDMQAELHLRTTEDLAAADLEVLTSAGSVSALERVGEGEYRATYTAPKLNYPHLAVMTIADRGRPEDVLGCACLPLIGKVPFPVKVAPNAEVSLIIDGQSFGPEHADAKGSARVMIKVAPGQQVATRVVQVGGTEQTEDIDLKVPETLHIQLFPTVAALPGDPATQIAVRLAVRTADGLPDPNAAVHFSVDHGRVGAPEYLGDGIYRAIYTAEAVAVPTDVTLKAALEGSSIQKSERHFTLVPALPDRLHLDVEPRELSPQGAKVKIFARAIGSDGKGLGDRSWSVLGVGATAQGQVADLRNGDYRIDLAADLAVGPAVVAAISSPPTGLPADRVLIKLLKDRVPADGASRVPFAVSVVDAYGYPVPDATVRLQLVGDGQVPAEVQTGPTGIGLGLYTAGTAQGLVSLEAAADGVLGDQVGVVQGPGAGALPIGGSPEEIAVRQRWGRSIALVEIRREDAPGALSSGEAQEAQAEAAPPAEEPAPPTLEEAPAEEPAAPPREEAPAGAAVTELEVRAAPDSVAPGGKVALRVSALDEAGRGVPGVGLEFMLSQGSVGKVRELGVGEYECDLSVPASATGQVKVTVIAGDGEVVKFSKVPVAPAPKGEVISLDGPQPDAPKVRAPREKTPRADDGPSVAVWGGLIGSSYHYEQVPLVEDGPLLPSIFSVGGDNGDKSAAPLGAELGVGGWYLPWLGAELGLRSSHYTVTADEFAGDSIGDNLTRFRADLLGRYSVDVGSARVHLGLRAGLRADDLIVYMGSVEAGHIDYQALNVFGADVGLDLGLSAGALEAHLGLSEGLSSFTLPYATEWTLGASYDLDEHLFVRGALDGSSRSIPVVGLDSGRDLGELSDGQTLLIVGAGWRL